MPLAKICYWKMVSTDYLGEVYRLVMIKAAEAKLLSFGCSRDVLLPAAGWGWIPWPSSSPTRRKGAP